MAKPTDGQLLRRAYERYRIASRLAGYAALPFPDWMTSLVEFELVIPVLDSEKELVVT